MSQYPKDLEELQENLEAVKRLAPFPENLKREIEDVERRASRARADGDAPQRRDRSSE
jgi:hypothetical protein